MLRMESRLLSTERSSDMNHNRYRSKGRAGYAMKAVAYITLREYPCITQSKRKIRAGFWDMCLLCKLVIEYADPGCDWG